MVRETYLVSLPPPTHPWLSSSTLFAVTYHLGLLLCDNTQSLAACGVHLFGDREYLQEQRSLSEITDPARTLHWRQSKKREIKGCVWGGGRVKAQHTFRPSSWLESVDFPAFGVPRSTTRRIRGFSGMSGDWTKRRSCSPVFGWGQEWDLVQSENPVRCSALPTHKGKIQDLVYQAEVIYT
jgi:hypothetical protein